MEPTVDPLESKGRINHIQCKDEDLGSGRTEEEAVYEEKEGDWGTGMALGGPSQAPESFPQREQEGNPTVEWGNRPLILGGGKRPKDDPRPKTEAQVI